MLFIPLKFLHWILYFFNVQKFFCNLLTLVNFHDYCRDWTFLFQRNSPIFLCLLFTELFTIAKTTIFIVLLKTKKFKEIKSEQNKVELSFSVFYLYILNYKFRVFSFFDYNYFLKDSWMDTDFTCSRCNGKYSRKDKL